jgi:hypothetical protein
MLASKLSAWPSIKDIPREDNADLVEREAIDVAKRVALYVLDAGRMEKVAV